MEIKNVMHQAVALGDRPRAALLLYLKSHPVLVSWFSYDDKHVR